MEGHLQTAMKAVGQAIHLDGSGNNKEAYFRYLACIKYISEVVLEESKNQGYQGPIKTQKTTKMLKLAQQCMDRASAIMENTVEEDASSLAPPPVDSQSGRFSPSIRSSSPQPPYTTTEQPRAYEPSAAFQSLSNSNHTSARETSSQASSLEIPAGYMRPQTARKDKLTPLEVAYLKNQQLMNSYRSRLMQMMDSNRVKGQLNKTNLNLTLQRRLMENMAIARAREAALAKKIQERHQRLQEEAARRFSTSGEPTKPELELRQIYASIMEFESNERWLSEWRSKLQESPTDLQFIHALVNHILACSDHPFTQLLNKFQYTIYQSLLPLVQKDAKQLEQIKIPYKMVQPLELAGSRQRILAPNGFANPGDLVEKNVDEDLVRRLRALRNSSDDERRESLYGDMLASSSSVDEDKDDDLWDELHSNDEDEEETASADDGGAAESETTSVKSRVSIEVEFYADKETSRDSIHDSERRNEEEVDIAVKDTNSCSAVAASNGESNLEETEVCQGVSKDRTEEDLIDDVGDQMRSVNVEIRHDLEEAFREGEELKSSLEKEITEDLAKALSENGDAENLSASRNVQSQDITVGGVSEDGNENVKQFPSSADEKAEENEESVEDTHECKNGDDSDSDESQELKELEQMQDSAGDGQGVTEDGYPSQETDTGDSPGLDDASQEQTAEEETLVDETRDKEKEEQERIAKLQEDALQRHLKHISKDIHSYLDRLQSLLIATYEELDSAVAKEQCIAIIEKHFFRLIWQPLLTLFRRSNLTKEIKAATAMTKYQNALPENIGIIKKLCLVNDEEVHSDADNYPYKLAVEELRRISGYFSPLEKLECVVKASRAIITCVGDHYEAQGRPRQNTENAVGCDDLLPILSYVLIKSALPHIVSECSIMEEFIHEGYLFGEEGYCLTTLQTSLGYVLKLAED